MCVELDGYNGRFDPRFHQLNGREVWETYEQTGNLSPPHPPTRLSKDLERCRHEISNGIVVAEV
jgi:hypothetical protein